MNTAVSQLVKDNGKSTATSISSWDDIQWRVVEGYVKKLQYRIYEAEVQGNKKKVKGLQRLLMKSRAALLLSIRQITQKN